MIKITEEVKGELEKALEHIESVIYSSKNYNPLYDPRESVYEFMHKYNPDKENVDGKLWVVSKVLLEIVTEYKPDSADNKNWRELEEEN